MITGRACEPFIAPLFASRCNEATKKNAHREVGVVVSGNRYRVGCAGKI
jgi:hypothetical protein